MTKEELIELLEKRGYKPYPPHVHGEGVIWAGALRLPEGSPECETNEHKISWHVRVWDFDMHDQYGRSFQSVDLEICGELHKQWYTLKAYGIDWKDVNSTVFWDAEYSLLKAWEAIAGVGKR